MSPFDHNSKTRISIVNPLTGDLETSETTSVDGNVLEATKIRSVSNPNNQPPRQSAEFIPHCGNRPTDEITSLWEPPQKAIVQSLLQYLASRPLMAKIALPLGSVVIALSVCVFGLNSQEAIHQNDAVKTSPDASRLEENSEPTFAHATPPPATPPPATPLVPIQTEPLRTKNVVDALFEGRLDDALALYRQLHQLNPEDPRFKLAVEILSRPSR